MKVQQTRNLQLNNQPQKQPVAFKGGESLIGALNFIDTNPAWGAILVDLASMVIPRTIVDFTRSPEAGVETGRRELICSANMGLLGFYGAASAWALAHGFNKDYKGIKANDLIMDNDTLDILSNVWNKHRNPEGFLTEVLENTRGFNPNRKGNKNGWIGIKEQTRREVVERLIQDINATDKTKISEAKAYVKSLIADSLNGTESTFRIESDIKKPSDFPIHTLEEFIDKIYKTAQTFNASKVAETFTQHGLKNNPFIARLKKLNAGTAAAGLTIAAVCGLLQQPVNMYLTRKKTGKAGFVGVENKDPDNSAGFKVLKTGLAILATAGAMLTIGKGGSEILRKIQFKGLNPTLDQFKFIYGITIASRLLSSRDKHELRETSIKDSLGFVNWLILGSFVSKLTALGIQNMSAFKKDGTKFVKYAADKTKTGWLRQAVDWIKNSSLVSRDEILHAALGKTIKSGSKTAMSFKEMLKNAPAARTKIHYLGVIQFAGYLYSCLVLGIGIPKLNIAITKYAEAKNKAAGETSAPEANQNNFNFLKTSISHFKSKTSIN